MREGPRGRRQLRALVSQTGRVLVRSPAVPPAPLQAPDPSPSGVGYGLCVLLRCLLALAGGLVLAAAFEPVGFAWLMPPAIAVLVLCVRGLRAAPGVAPEPGLRGRLRLRRDGLDALRRHGRLDRDVRHGGGLLRAARHRDLVEHAAARVAGPRRAVVGRDRDVAQRLPLQRDAVRPAGLRDRRHAVGRRPAVDRHGGRQPPRRTDRHDARVGRAAGALAHPGDVRRRRPGWQS